MVWFDFPELSFAMGSAVNGHQSMGNNHTPPFCDLMPLSLLFYLSLSREPLCKHTADIYILAEKLNLACIPLGAKPTDQCKPTHSSHRSQASILSVRLRAQSFIVFPALTRSGRASKTYLNPFGYKNHSAQSYLGLMIDIYTSC